MDPELLAALMAQLGGDYGYGLPPELAALLATDVSGLGLRDANSLATLDGKLTNNFQDSAKSLLDPLIRVLLGTYLPQAPTGDSGAPALTVTSRYLNEGPETTWGSVAQGLLDGSLSPVAAYNLVAASPDGATMDGQAIWAQINSMTKEIADRDNFKSTANAEDPFAKAGLPSPLERYTDDLDQDGVVDSVPINPATAQYFSDQGAFDAQLETLKGMRSEWERSQLTPSLTDAERREQGLVSAPKRPSWLGPEPSAAPTGGKKATDGRTYASEAFLLGDNTAEGGDRVVGRISPTLTLYGDNQPSPPAQPSVEGRVAITPSAKPFAQQEQYERANRASLLNAALSRGHRNERARRLDAAGNTPLRDNLMQTLLKFVQTSR